MYCVMCGLMDELAGELNNNHECSVCENLRLDMLSIKSEDYDVRRAGINPNKKITFRKTNSE